MVVSTWALAYLDRQGRLNVCAAIDDHGARRDVAFVTAESPHVTPWVHAPVAHDGTKRNAPDAHGRLTA